MRLIVGLGNPGQRYKDTWHNMGALVVEALASRWQASFKPGKGKFIYAEALRTQQKITLMIPTSFMNRSGEPVSDWMRYYGATQTDLLVVYDDHDLKLGQIRLRTKGSSGGHHGMDDIIRLFGTDEINRLKIGIRSESEASELSHQVLSKIPRKLHEKVEHIVNTAADAIEDILSRDLISAMNQYNGIEIE